LQEESAFYALPTCARPFAVHIVASSINSSSQKKRHLFVLVALTLLFAVLCAYALLLDKDTHWDAALSQWILLYRNPGTDQLMLGITMSADFPVSAVLLMAVVMLLLRERHWWLSVYVSCLFLSTHLGVMIIKSLTQRTRPALTDSTLSLMSFPSGHAARAVLVFGALALLLSWGRCTRQRTLALMIAGVLSSAVMASRVYLGAHWTSDVLAGAVLAAIMLVGLDWQLQVHDEQSVRLPATGLLSVTLLGYSIYYLQSMRIQAGIYGLAIQ